MTLSVEARNKRIVQRRRKGETLPSIAKRYEITTTRVWQIVTRRKAA